ERPVNSLVQRNRLVARRKQLVGKHACLRSHSSHRLSVPPCGTDRRSLPCRSCSTRVVESTESDRGGRVESAGLPSAPPTRGRTMKRIAFAVVILLAASEAGRGQEKPEVTALPGTKPLTMKGDIASQLVEGVDRFLLKEIDKSVERRARHWKRDFSSAEAYNK